MADLAAIYERFFEIRVATAAADVEEARRVRHRVYCLEKGYFSPELHPNGLEEDIYDERSVESVLFYRPTDTAVGAVRLILPGSEAASLASLPFDEVCDSASLYRSKTLQRESTAEVSRLCLTRGLRREIQATPLEAFEGLEGPPASPEQTREDLGRRAILGLLRAVVDLTARSGVTHWCGIAEPRLLKSLERMSIRLVRHGPEVGHYGQRQPCYAEVATTLQRIREQRVEVWNAITDRGRVCP